MKLTLRNLGRLREATIDLSKDLIVLTGPNNTSKTYVAHAVYGFSTNFLNDLYLSFGTASEELSVGKWDGLRYHVEPIAFVERHLPLLLSQVAQRYREQLPDVLATQSGFIAHSEVLLETKDEHLADAKNALRQLKVNEELRGSAGVTYRVLKDTGEPVWTYERVSMPVTENAVSKKQQFLDRRFLLRTAQQDLVSIIGREILRIPVNPYILTAERAAIQLFSRELSRNRSELVDSLAEIKSGVLSRQEAGSRLLDVVEQQTRRYPLAIRNSLIIADDLASYREQTSPLAFLADKLESDVLGGATHVDASGETSFKPMGSETSLSLHLSSSSVKSLAGLSFYLRYMAGQQKFLIIDEPELNLHPDNQRRVARSIARIVRAGVKVLISTHSDYLIRELNNLIMLSADKDGSVAKQCGYSEHETLAPTQVAAYLFSPERANPIEVKSTGIEVETIDQEINALNKATQDIYFSLFGDKNV